MENERIYEVGISYSGRTYHDAGEDISPSLDISKARRPQQEQKRVNVFNSEKS